MGPALSFLGAVFFGAAAGASAAYVIAVNLTRLALLSLASKLAAPKLDLSQSAANKMLTVRGSVTPQAFVYGQDMLSGPLIFANTANENKDLHRLVALTGREIDSFVAFRIDDTDIEIGVDIADDNDVVTGGDYADVVEIYTQLGTSTQTAIASLTAAFASLWTSAHRARGWATLHTKMIAKGKSDAFSSGIPQNLRALIKGHLIYDPRLDGTNGGTGSHRYDDDTTWEWSENPALCLADWLMFAQVGLGEDPERIDWELVAAAADVCEELVAIPTSSTQQRYTCNFTFFADQPREQIKEILETAMLGRCIFSQGKWRMWAGEALAATVTLSEANLRGGISLQATMTSEDRYNRVRGKFIDPSRNYTANPYPEQRSSSFVTDDNGIVYKTFDFNACNNSFECQRNAIIRLRQSRNLRPLVFEGNWSCFRVQPGTTVLISNDELGYSAEKYFVSEWSLDKSGGGVNLTMIPEQDTDWADPIEGDYTVRSVTGILGPPATSGAQLSDANIHNIRASGTCTAGVQAGADGLLKYSDAAGAYSTAGVPAGEWRRDGAEYWMRCTLNSGLLNVGTEDTWEALTADLEYSTTSGTGGEANITLEIASDDAGADIVATGIFDLLAELSVADVSHPDVNETVTVGSGQTARFKLEFGYEGSIDEHMVTVTTNNGGVSPADIISYQSWWHGVGDPPEHTTGNIQVRYNVTGGTEGEWSTGNHGTQNTWVTITNGAPPTDYTLQRLSSAGAGTTSISVLVEFRWSTNPSDILSTFTIDASCIKTA